ncbi:MAG: SDR family oxidoreductase [Methanomassiliicoccus sp.]|nr:SDR family oxidoreductase [Methanomassiliicoccus sp.]
MSKIVVTGGAGFIGSHLAEELAKEHKVVVVDNLDDYYSPEIKRANLELLRRSKNITFVHGDITDPHLVQEIIDTDVDYVFHEAAQAGVRVSVNDPFKPNRINVLGTLNVLSAALQAGVERVINASSSSVYGKVQYLPFDEKHPTQPVSPYGVSKLAAEHYCRVFYEVYGLPTVSLRYFTVYGPRMRPDLAISIFTGRLLRNEPITIFGDGSKTRDFTYIDDIVDANIRLLRTGEADGGVLNIGGGSAVSIADLAKKLKALTGSRSEILYAEKQMGDAEHTLADTALARRTIGFEPMTSIDEGLRKFVQWYASVVRVPEAK